MVRMGCPDMSVELISTLYFLSGVKLSSDTVLPASVDDPQHGNTFTSMMMVMMMIIISLLQVNYVSVS